MGVGTKMYRHFTRLSIYHLVFSFRSAISEENPSSF